MRLIASFTPSDSLNPLVYSSLLTAEGIDHSLEPAVNSMGEKTTEVWIVEEDAIEKASELLESYRQNPKIKPIFKTPSTPTVSTHPSVRTPSLRPKGLVSAAVLVACILLFVWSVFARPKKELQVQWLTPSPALSQIEKNLLYDYPLYFQLKDALMVLLAQDPSNKTKESQELYEKLLAMPVWMGITQQILQYRKLGTSLFYEGPLFEKMRKGEIWRVITPVFLHLDFLHIFFNLLWFLILAPQIEERIGFFRFSLLFLLGSIIPNTAQYLISGPFFMGLSGVICALAGFIWARQRVAPWEGYLLQRATIVVLTIFIGGLFLLSFAFFWLQFFSIIHFSLPIANTAHVIGGLVGYFLGKRNFFASHI